MVCIPCLLLPLAGILVVLFDFIKPFLIKIGLIQAQPKPSDSKTNIQENGTKVQDMSTDQQKTKQS